MYMKRASANICYTHSTEENMMLISFDFYNINLGLTVSLIRIPYSSLLSMSTAIRDDDNVKHTFDQSRNLIWRFV